MHIKNLKPQLKKSLVIAILAASAAQVNNVFAESAPISGADMLDQAVALYEKLQDCEVSLPEQLSDSEIDEYLLKSVVLGYINLDEAEDASLLEEARKQDVMNILYKTIINYDSSYILSEEEASLILNDCYDNALIDEENRIAYAFMIKQGIITEKVDTQPNKHVTWDSCRILVDLVYDYFLQDTTFTLNDTAITMGANVESIISVMGAPDRIDKSDYGYEWYVYNSDADNYCMIGVDGERICGFFTNAKKFGFNGQLYKGDDISNAEEVTSSKNIRFFADSQGKIDSVIYTSRENGHSSRDEVAKSRAIELLDIINAYREQRGYEPYVLDLDLSNASWMKSLEAVDSGNQTDSSFISADIYSTYSKLLKSDNPVLTNNSSKESAIGIDVTLEDEKYYTSFCIDEETDAKELEEFYIANRPSDEKKEKAVVDNTKTFGIIPTVSAEGETIFSSSEVSDNEPEAPEILNSDISSVAYGEDIVLKIANSQNKEYLVEVYDFETESYLINSYIKAENNSISISADVLTEGVDYNITVSTVTDDGKKLSAEDIMITYGDGEESGVKITTEGGVTENDYIALKWESEQYHDFYVDVYNSNGDFVVSTIIEDDNEALIQGLDPDKYCVYVTALRRGTTVEKAQDLIKVEIKLPEPVINEYILDKEDKYYFVYEDADLGVLYFYDEEIIDVEENGKTVKKKKIIQKQVKSTKAYRQLAKYQKKLTYVTGEPVSLNYGSSIGDAIVSEAMQYLGVPYVWGGTTPEGFDCSGLVQYVCKSLGISIDRVTHEQVSAGYKVERENLRPGDLVFFKQDSGYVGHVGIYVGDNKFLHAPSAGDVVKISELTGYYDERYYEGRRVY